jgi:hypothetical protein
MGQIIELDVWRQRRQPVSPDGDAASSDRLGTWGGEEDVELRRLEAAVAHLHPLVTASLRGSGHVGPTVETELLAIMGELTVGLVTDAAHRAERLADRMRARRGKGGGQRTARQPV